MTFFKRSMGPWIWWRQDTRVPDPGSLTDLIQRTHRQDAENQPCLVKSCIWLSAASHWGLLLLMRPHSVSYRAHVG